MITVFTICSNNYLGQAKSLGDSLIKHNPSYEFVIGLVDRYSEEIDYSFFEPYQIISIEDLKIPDFHNMVDKYNITELNTSVKPFIFDYFFNLRQEIRSIIYLDPDIIIYKTLDHLNSVIKENNIILTPHFFTSIFDEHIPSEPTILNAGLYNLGFIAVNRSEESTKFIKWWMLKLKDQCFIDFEAGLFVDQLWINFVPLYFKKVHILRELGYNVAYWNLHEREVSIKQNQVFVNGDHPLYFFHFSGFNPRLPHVISKHQTRFNFSEFSDLKALFDDYSVTLRNNGFYHYSLIPNYFLSIKRKKWRDQAFVIKTDSFLRKVYKKFLR